ncbi:MAG: deoxyribodipyrimidine photo-lyase [Desulfobacterales bacterium]
MRVQPLNDLDLGQGDFVLYWMQQSQRVEYNHALEYAIQQANKMDQAVLVVFALMDNYPEANLRHYSFMLQGLKETQQALSKRGIKMIVRRGQPADIALSIGRRASLIVCDHGYLRHQRQWRKAVASKADCRVVQVESDVVVPVEVVSGKAEYAARTIRPKIHKHLKNYLSEFKPTKIKKSSLNIQISGLDLNNLEAVAKKIKNI